jgi:hypothetical protein
MTQQSASKLGYVGAVHGTVDRNAWFTPPKYVEAARTVLGLIHFDPYSDDVANHTVKADLYRTKQNQLRELVTGQDAILPEVETVWMNPPYSRGEIDAAVDEFIFEYRRQRFSAIVLTNNATETQWFHSLMVESDSMCFTDHRIAFTNTDGKAISGNTRGQVFFCFGDEPTVKRFHEVFDAFGTVIC